MTEMIMQPHGAGPQKIALPGVKSVVAVAIVSCGVAASGSNRAAGGKDGPLGSEW